MWANSDVEGGVANVIGERLKEAQDKAHSGLWGEGVGGWRSIGTTH